MDCKFCLDYMVFEDNQLIFRCFECRKNYKKDFNKELIKRFANIYEFCNGDISKFILLLRKGVYAYELMDSWERFYNTSFPDREAFYSSLNMEDITDDDYRNAKRVFKYLYANNKNLGVHHGSMFRVIRYLLQMYLRILEINVLKYMNGILLMF